METSFEIPPCAKFKVTLSQLRDYILLFAGEYDLFQGYTYEGQVFFIFTLFVYFSESK